jgi:hypothetical protein
MGRRKEDTKTKGIENKQASQSQCPHRGQGGLGGQSRVRAGLAAAGKLESFPDLLAKHHI